MIDCVIKLINSSAVIIKLKQSSTRCDEKIREKKKT